MRHFVLLLLVSIMSLATQPSHAAVPHAHARALAAGYKAAFVCSDNFTAGQTEAQIDADDLTGIYPEYAELVKDLPAVIDRAAKTVSVAFDDRLPPRVAAWRPLLGCAQLPVGADPASAAMLPRLDLAAPDLAATDALAWPYGDAYATARLPRAKASALDKVVAAAFDGATFGKGGATTAVIVLVDGHIVAERYRGDFDRHTPQRTWSVAKSLTATLVGRAVALGKADVTAPANILEWRAPGDPRAAITVDQLLRMNSGLWTNGPGNRTDEVYLGGSTVPQTAAAMPLEAAPGSRFRYANNDMLLAAYSLRTSLGGGALAFPFRELLWPLGMTRTTPETDHAGNYVLSSQVWMTARDLARLALLYANDGVAAGKRLLPVGWVRSASTPSGAQPAPDTRSGVGYGAGLWLHGPADGLPAGAIAMEGNRGQYAFIVGGARLIVVRRGFDAAGAAFDGPAFVRAVVAALPGDASAKPR